MIRVGNLRNLQLKENEILIKIDRSTIVGNPFYMKREEERNTVCDKYNEYFYKQIAISSKFNKYILDIIEKSKTKDIILGCWCHPKRCHGDTILNYLNTIVK